MTDFNGTSDDYERLRGALLKLYDDGEGITSGALLNRAEEFYSTSDRTGPTKRGISFPHYSSIDKFRDGTTRRIDFSFARNIWDFLRVQYPTTLGLTPANLDEHFFFDYSAIFFDVHKHRSARTDKHMTGIYKMYQYSYEFNDYSDDIACAIIVSRLLISIDDKKTAIFVEEKQHYDGHLGKGKMAEVYTGYLFPKGKNFYIICKNKMRETPRFYVLYKPYYDPETAKIHAMKGYMLTGLYDDDYFHSPVYVIRDDDDSTPCNILLPSRIPDNIMNELNKDLVIIRARGRSKASR